MKHCRINVDGRLYVVGELLFESLVSLVNYYTRNPLYRNVKLTYPISKDVLKTMTKKYGNGTLVMTLYFSLNYFPVYCVECYSFNEFIFLFFSSNWDRMSKPTII